MTEFDQAQSPRLGQRTPYEGTTVRMFTGADLPEVSVHGQLIYRSDTQELQVYNEEEEAWEDVVGGQFGLLTFVGPEPPSAESIGDLWFDSNDGNHPYRASAVGTGSWVSMRDGSIAVVGDIATNAANDAADALQQAAEANTAAIAAASAASNAQTSATNAMSAATAAQATADGAIRTWYQATAPTGLNNTSDVGDLWFDTDDNQAYRWNGTTWVIIEDNSIAAALSAAQDAQTTADGKITAYYSDTAPVTGELGDLWYDTNDGNKTYYVSAVGPLVWTPLPTGLGGLGTDVTAGNLGGTTPDSISEDLSGESVSELSITAPIIQTDPQSDQGIHLDNAGLRAYPPAGGTPFFDVKPAEGVVITTGKGTFDTVTVNTKAELAGVTEVKSGGVVQLVSGTMPPNSAPIVGSSYAQIQFTNDGLWGNRYGWSFDGTYYHTVRRHSSGGYYAERWTTSGTLNHTSVYSGPNMTVYSCVWGGNALYVLNKQSTGTWYVDRLLADPADSTPYDGVQYFAPWNHPNTDGKTPTIGYDASNGQLLIAQSRPTDATTPGCIRIRRYTFSTFTESLALISTVDTASAWDNGLSAVLGGSSFDLGAARVVLASVGSGDIQVLTTDGYFLPAETWPSGMTAKVGMIWTGTEFKSMDDNGVFRTYTQQDKLVNNADSTQDWVRERWVYWTWYRSTGPFETTTSPKQFFTQNKRTQLTITAPTATPASPGANDPDGVRFYVGKSADNTSTEPARTAQWRQSTNTGSGVVHTVRLDSLATSGSVPPDPANAARTDKFPDAVPSKVVGTKKRSDSVTPVVDIPDSGVATMDGLLPPGSIMMWCGITAPPGWAICDGSELSRTGTTKPLADACLISGTNYRFGNGNGTTTFNLPDLRGRFPYGFTPGGVGAYKEIGAFETSTAGGTHPSAGAPETRLNHAHTHDTTLSSHTHTISGQAAGGTVSSGTAAGTAPSQGAYSGHAHGGETGGVVGVNPSMTSNSKGLNDATTANHGFLTLNFIIKL